MRLISTMISTRKKQTSATIRRVRSDFSHRGTATILGKEKEERKEEGGGGRKGCEMRCATEQKAWCKDLRSERNEQSRKDVEVGIFTAVLH